MKILLTFVIVALGLSCHSAGQTLQQVAPTPTPVAAAASRALANHDPAYVALRSIRVGTEMVRIKDFTLKRDAGTFVFHSGAFHLLEPVAGKITGAIFIGEGSFSLTPPIQVEQRYLGILTKGQPFVEEFGSAVFRFTDGTEQDIKKAAVNDSSSAAGDPNGLLDDVRQQLRKKLRSNLDARLLEDVLSSRQGGAFFAFINFFAAWHHDFGAAQASVLNRMVMLYALPMSLFAGMDDQAGGTDQ
jgi:hypothetical protein